MTNTPEKIWVDPDSMWEVQLQRNLARDVEYIRADLVPTWRPISEVPDNWEKADLWVVPTMEGEGFRLPDCYFCSGFWWDQEEYAVAGATHWMPIPQGPDE